MSTPPLLPGISSNTVHSSRLKVHFLSRGAPDGIPIIFVHGNVSSSRFWEETMLALPDSYRSFALDLRGFGLTEGLPIDATRGLRDYSDDLHAFSQALSLSRFHLLGWSMGGGVVMQYAIDHPDRLHSLTLIAPVSPFGFGGTQGVTGRANYNDFALSGGGGANPEFVKRLATADRSSISQSSPRQVMNAFYFKPPFTAQAVREEVFVSSMLSTRIGDAFYPGNMTPSLNWPGIAPGTKGVLNAISPKYCNLSALTSIAPKPPILWVRGADDQIISDTSFFDFAFLGQIGLLPGWPGPHICPPQPMIQQTRYVLKQYQANGGHYQESVIPNCGHSPHIEKPQAFRSALLKHLQL